MKDMWQPGGDRVGGKANHLHKDPEGTDRGISQRGRRQRGQEREVQDAARDWAEATSSTAL